MNPLFWIYFFFPVSNLYTTVDPLSISFQATPHPQAWATCLAPHLKWEVNAPETGVGPDGDNLGL